MSTILLVDDDVVFCTQMGEYISRLGHVFHAAHTLKDGLHLARDAAPDIVFLDVILPDGLGLEHIEHFRDAASSPEVIVVTGQGAAETAESAIESGASYFLRKPSPLGEIRELIQRIQATRLSSAQNRPHKLPAGIKLVGSSPKLRQCLEKAFKAALTGENILVTGETGTGKELISRIIHAQSPRRNERFVAVDCTSIPESLAESLLFGHVQGAFTGAARNSPGLVLLADKGTLFLDEIGDMPDVLQKSLLRVLQEKRFRPIGSSKEISSDFRVIAATNRDIPAIIKEGRFRSDLFYRLSAFQIHVPSLSERPEDIPVLAKHYMDKICTERNMAPKSQSEDFKEIMQRHAWPGNVRELINTLHLAVVNAMHEPELHPHHLPKSIRAGFYRSALERREPTAAEPAPEPAVTPMQQVMGGFDDFPTLKDVRDAVNRNLEQEYLEQLRAECGGKVLEACRLAGITRSRLYQLLQKYGISLK